MTIVLRDWTARTSVVICGADEAVLSAGMQFCRAALPRSLEEDRRFVARLSEPDWNGVHLGGIETPADIEKASALLRVAEANRNMAPSSLSILAGLDTAKAALGLADFHRTIPRLCGFIFDAKALASASGAAADSALVGDIRLRLPLAARASGAIAFLTTGDDAPETMAKAAREGYGGLCVRPG